MESCMVLVKEFIKITTVIWQFPNQLIIGINHFEVNMMMHLDFCEPTLKNCIEILNLTIQWVWVGGFPGHLSKFSLCVSFLWDTFKIFMHQAKPTLDLFVNCNVQGVLF